MFLTIKHLHLNELKHLKIAQLDYIMVKLVGLQGLRPLLFFLNGNIFPIRRATKSLP